MTAALLSPLVSVLHVSDDGLQDADSDDDVLLLLGLSVWMRTCGIDAFAARDVLTELAGRLVEVAGLDPLTEPVPLVPRDDRGAVVALGRYTGSLAARAAAVAGRPVSVLLDEALARCVPGTDCSQESSGTASHHWHHQSPPTRIRSLGCQQ